MNTEDLIACAEYLIKRPESDLTQADINRAASTSYYVLFHVLSQKCANLFMGEIHQDYRRAWQQVYRALGHDNAKTRCKESDMVGKFPNSIQDFADKFVSLQEMRHQCDYDPLSRTAKTTVEVEIGSLRDVVSDFLSTPEMDLRAFCSFLLFPKREDLLRKEIEKQRKEDQAKALRAEQEAKKAAVQAERAAKRAAGKEQAKA